MQNVTIVICNYNYGRFLAKAINSALDQDYPATQVLVIDDGSTDGSREIIESYGCRVKALYKQNGGQVSAYNDAVNLIETEFVILLDSDDLLYSHAVSKVMRVFDSGNFVKVQFRLRRHRSRRQAVGYICTALRGSQRLRQPLAPGMVISVAACIGQRLPHKRIKEDISRSRG
ncbi:glycosyltransferase family 2 protein [Paraburkholderia strydomiana]